MSEPASTESTTSRALSAAEHAAGMAEYHEQGLRLARELGEDPDVLLAGINGSRLGLYDFDRRLLTSTGFPPVVLPTHWDNFRLPYGFSQQANIERNILPFIEAAREISPETMVITPVHLEKIWVR